MALLKFDSADALDDALDDATSVDWAEYDLAAPLEDGTTPLEHALGRFEDCSVGVRAQEGSFDGVGSITHPVGDLCEACVAMIEVGAPKTEGVRQALQGIAEDLADFKGCGESVGAEPYIKDAMRAAKARKLM